MDRSQKRQKREDGADIVAAAMARMESAAVVAGFIPSSSFTGVRPGYVFKKGISGVGYYPDKIEQDKLANKASQQPAQQVYCIFGLAVGGTRWSSMLNCAEAPVLTRVGNEKALIVHPLDYVVPS